MKNQIVVMRKHVFMYLQAGVLLGALLPLLASAEAPPTDGNPPSAVERRASVPKAPLDRAQMELAIQRFSKELTSRLVRQLIDMALNDEHYVGKPFSGEISSSGRKR